MWNFETISNLLCRFLFAIFPYLRRSFSCTTRGCQIFGFTFFIDLKMELHILYMEEAHLCGYVTPEEYPGDFWEGWVKFFISCVAAPRPSLVHWLGAPLTRCSSLRKLNYNLRVGGYFVRRLVAKVWLSTSVLFEPATSSSECNALSHYATLL